jgi:outer membrane protein assembly factor BamA
MVAAGAFSRPEAFGPGTTEGYERVEVAADSRPERPRSQTGVRLQGTLEHGTSVRHAPASSWIKYGGSLGGFWDVTGHQRVVSLTATAELADPVQGGGIPFTEQVVWGGSGALAGFLPGRLHGRSGAAATLRYEWPIWTWLDGTLHAAVGNVFDAGFRDFDTKLLRASWGVGVRSSGSPDHQFEVVVGFGTETFDQGAKVDSFRLGIGGTHGF